MHVAYLFPSSHLGSRKAPKIRIITMEDDTHRLEQARRRKMAQGTGRAPCSVMHRYHHMDTRILCHVMPCDVVLPYGVMRCNA